MILLVFLFAGDMLIFMPGQEDIECTCDLIAGTTVNYVINCFVKPLQIITHRNGHG